MRFHCFREEDDEITSESEVGSGDEHVMQQDKRHLLKRKIKMTDYPEFLEKRQNSFQKYRCCHIQGFLPNSNFVIDILCNVYPWAVSFFGNSLLTYWIDRITYLSKYMVVTARSV